MNRNRLCLWLSLVAVACSKVGADSVAPPAPPVYTIQAGFAAEVPETRSRLDFEETQARVLWTGGDAFRMYRMFQCLFPDDLYDPGRRRVIGDVHDDKAAWRG